jgi:hypothetical protein
MNPADKTVQELIQSLSQSEQTIQQLTEILSKSEKRSQWLERTFRWLAILFICLTMTIFYIGFDWVNHAQATADVQPTTAQPTTPKTTPPGTPKQEEQSCRQGMQLMMVKQAQDLMLTSLTLNKEIQQLPQSQEKEQMVNMNKQLGDKLNSFFLNMNNIFNDNSRIFCQIFLRVDNLTRKLNEFKADWTVVRMLLLKALLFTKNKQEQAGRTNQQDPLYPVAKLILNYLDEKKAITINDKNQITVLKASTVDNALSTYLAWGVINGLSSLKEVLNALRSVPEMNTNMEYMNANMEDMNAHMYYMMRNMGVMTGDMDSTLGRAGRNMPWMPW